MKLTFSFLFPIPVNARRANLDTVSTILIPPPRTPRGRSARKNVTQEPMNDFCIPTEDLSASSFRLS